MTTISVILLLGISFLFCTNNDTNPVSVAPPSILFSTDSIIHEEGYIPITAYSVNSESGLKEIRMYFLTGEGEQPYGASIQLSGKPLKYGFSEVLEYTSEVKGLVVKATDIHDQVGTGTLPIKYAVKEVENRFSALFYSFNPAGNGQFLIYVNVKDSLYTQFKVTHEVNESHNKNLWRVMDSYFSIYENGRMTQSTRILTNGENEFVWLANRPDVVEFTGGFHGNERIDTHKDSYARFFADDKEIDISKPYDLIPASSFYYHQQSLMYETGTGGTISSPNYVPVENTPVECVHEKKTEFVNNGYQTYNKLTWRDNLTSVKRAYYGIFCVTGDISRHGYNDTGAPNPEIIPLNDDGTMKLRSDKQRVVMFNDDIGISVVCDGEILQGGPFPLKTYVWDHQFYHKYYTAIEGSGPIQTTTGEIWETTASIKFKVNK